MSLVSNWIEIMLDLYKQGYSDVEVARELGVSKRQFLGYIERSPAFADLVEYGHDLAEAWALSQNRRFVTDEKVSANNVKALQSRLENMHGWSQKTEARNQNVNSELDIAKLKQELAGYAPEMLKVLGHDNMANQLTHQINQSNEE